LGSRKQDSSTVVLATGTHKVVVVATANVTVGIEFHHFARIEDAELTSFLVQALSKLVCLQRELNLRKKSEHASLLLAKKDEIS
jgi:hypothetical protein